MTALVVSTETGAESIGGAWEQGKWGSAPMDLQPTDRQYVRKKTYFSQWKVLIMGAGIFNVTICPS